jgi:hypothetical protein
MEQAYTTYGDTHTYVNTKIGKGIATAQFQKSGHPQSVREALRMKGLRSYFSSIYIFFLLKIFY